MGWPTKMEVVFEATVAMGAYILRHLDDVLGRDGIEALTTPVGREVDLCPC